MSDERTQLAREILLAAVRDLTQPIVSVPDVIVARAFGVADEFLKQASASKAPPCPVEHTTRL